VPFPTLVRRWLHADDQAGRAELEAALERRDGREDWLGQCAWMTLAVIRLANGLLALFAPGFLARQLGVSPETQPAMLYVFRMFGIRTVLFGAALFLQPAARPRALRQGILIHASDTTAALIAGVFGQLPARSALVAVLISATNTGLAIVAADRAGGSR
jgi:hypothetical protein